MYFLQTHCLFLLCLILSIPAGATEELSAETLSKVRKAAIEVHINGQMRGGGALLRHTSGKIYGITAAHLFHSPRDTCSIVAHSDEAFSASLSAYDLGHDLALLEVDPLAAKLVTLSLADSIPQDTHAIYNLGPALRRRILVLPGKVADSRLTYTDFASSHGYIRHFFVAGINPVFTSGGMWVNRSGEIIGIQHGRLLGEKAASSGLSLVSPPSAIRELLNARNITATPGIGGYVWELHNADTNKLEKFPPGTKGLFVDPVFDGRPLSEAGIKGHDLILSCDGHPLTRRSELLSTIRSKPVGSTFELVVITPGKKLPRTVVLRTDSLEEHWE